MIFNKTALALGVTSALVLASCSSPEETPENTAPTVTSAFYNNGNLTATASDAQNNQLTYSWTVAGSSIGIGSTLPAGSYVGTGEQTVTVIVSDGTLSTPYTFIADFGGSNTSNSAPVITSASNSGDILTAVASDADGDNLTYTWSVGTTVIGSTPTINISAYKPSYNGFQDVTLVVSDGTATDTQIVSSVNFGTPDVTNSSPVISSVVESGDFLIATATDSENDTLYYNWSIGGVLIASSTNNNLQISTANQTGSKVVTLEVSDGNSTDTSTINVDFGTDTTPTDTDTDTGTGTGGGNGESANGVTLDPNHEAVTVITDYDGSIDLDQKVIGTPGASYQTTGNPFDDAYFYLSPDISVLMDQSIEITSDAALIEKMKYVQQQPSAVWMDSTDTITAANGDGTRRSLIGHLDAALMQQAYYESIDGEIAPMTIVIIVYNLPDRDCAAFASNGKLIQVGKDGEVYDADVQGMGYANYRDEYIAPIKAAFANPKYASLRIVAMLEPDSFPNMITNTNEAGTAHTNGSLNPDPASLASDGYCDKILSFNNSAVTGEVTGEGTDDYPYLGLYADSLRLAIRELHEASVASSDNIYTYMDIGHAGWLGWDVDDDLTDTYAGYDGNSNGLRDSMESNMKRGVKYFKQLVDGADGAIDGQGMDWIRGFASNTSGYTPVEEPLITNSKVYEDVLALEDFYQFNASVDELTYVERLNEYFTTADSDGYFGTQSFGDIGFIIDTARNGWGATGSSRPVPGAGTPGTDDSKRVDTRVHRGHWCNVNDAGVGEVPKPSPVSSASHLDAFFWMKPPGESDGISFDIESIDTAAYNALDAVDQAIVDQTRDPVYAGKSLDTMCIPSEQREDVTVDVVPAMAPHAGAWFHKQYVMLIENAYPELGTSDYE